MATRGKGTEPATEQGVSNLGVGAALGLPLAPALRGRAYKLPPPSVSFAGAVPLDSTPEVEEPVSAWVVAVKSGRIRLTTVLGLGLRWPEGTRLHTQHAVLRRHGGKCPVLLVSPTTSKRGEHSALSEEDRLSLTRRSRRYLAVVGMNAQVLAAFRHSDPTTLLVAGPAALSHLLTDVWPDEV